MVRGVVRCAEVLKVRYAAGRSWRERCRRTMLLDWVLTGGYQGKSQIKENTQNGLRINVIYYLGETRGPPCGVKPRSSAAVVKSARSCADSPNLRHFGLGARSLGVGKRNWEAEACSGNGKSLTRPSTFDFVMLLLRTSFYRQ